MLHRRPPFTPPEPHPFRRALPAEVLRVEQEKPHDDDHDVKLFLLSFAAFFVCFYTFIF
ncbi:hypothetical protein [Sphingomonas sp.]|jgi:hypothetical protein|uniref:hypothetical protein n=1 Tax=Sphingomonas sp. TaxID=28214 RepID=UPI002D80C861|nr:hypothetical protein [Sphingomonas sp.]HEU0044150.1 hypothetical protein [Sphingomonas sp.]